MREALKALWAKVKAYPVRAVAVIESGLALGMGFGLGISPEQMALIITFSTGLLALLVEQNVTPVVKLPELTDHEDPGHDNLAGP